MNLPAKKLESLANLAIIIVAALVSIVLVKNYLLTNSVNSQSASAKVNNKIQSATKVSLPGVDWAKNRRTLVLALSNTCHYCSESAPFYQRLVKEHGSTKLIAVLPQTVGEGKRYLENLDVPLDEVRQAPLDSISVSGTPTLMLVDGNGIVVDSWVGRLTPAQETIVLQQLQQDNLAKK